MAFSISDDEVLYLYPYYPLGEKPDEMSKEVYHVFKKNWGLTTYLPHICADLFEAVNEYIVQNKMQKLSIAVAVMPSHSKGTYGNSLLKVAHSLARKFGYINASDLIQRIIDKTKSTEGGLRTVRAHLETLGLAYEIDDSVDVFIILDDITTSGSSLEAAKQLLVNNGVNADNVIKIAVAKTMYDYY